MENERVFTEVKRHGGSGRTYGKEVVKQLNTIKLSKLSKKKGRE